MRVRPPIHACVRAQRAKLGGDCAVATRAGSPASARAGSRPRARTPRAAAAAAAWGGTPAGRAARVRRTCERSRACGKHCRTGDRDRYGASSQEYGARRKAAATTLAHQHDLRPACAARNEPIEHADGIAHGAGELLIQAERVPEPRAPSRPFALSTLPLRVRPSAVRRVPLTASVRP